MSFAVETWWSDRRLAAAVADVVAVPKVAPADSFVLHAPLELLARTGLLAVRPARSARGGTPAPAGWPPRRGSTGPLGEPADGRPALDATSARRAGRRAGRRDRAPAISTTSTASRRRRRSCDASSATARSPAPVVASLAAAAHASILLYLFPRFAPDGSITGTLAARRRHASSPATPIAAALVRGSRRSGGQRLAGRRVARRADARSARQRLHLPDHAPGRGVGHAVKLLSRLRDRARRCPSVPGASSVASRHGRCCRNHRTMRPTAGVTASRCRRR